MKDDRKDFIQGLAETYTEQFVEGIDMANKIVEKNPDIARVASKDSVDLLIELALSDAEIQADLLGTPKENGDYGQVIAKVEGMQAGIEEVVITNPGRSINE